MKTTKLIIGLLFLLMLGYTANAQKRSMFNSDNEIYSDFTVKIWKIEESYSGVKYDEPRYYILINHPLYGDSKTHKFTLSQLREVYCYALNYMEGKEFEYKKTIGWAKMEHSHGKIHFKLGFNSKRKPYTKVELSFYDSEWIHGYSETVRLESLLKWIGEDFKEWINPDWKDKYCK